MTKCMKHALIAGGIGGVTVGLLAWLSTRNVTTWAMAKRIGLPLAAGGAIAIVAGFAAKYSCESSTLSPSYRGLPVMGSVPRGLKCPNVPAGVSKWSLRQGLKVEMEHTDSREWAACIRNTHLHEDRGYYYKLAKMEA